MVLLREHVRVMVVHKSLQLDAKYVVYDLLASWSVQATIAVSDSDPRRSRLASASEESVIILSA